MGLFSSFGKLFSYTSPDEPMEGEKLRRFQLMGMTNKQLNELLELRPHKHCKKEMLVDLVIEAEAGQDTP
tara:strand:- start:275 stop:484 length:210 start_codon:yes stop_codon:yes gene_type:complete